MRVLISAAIGRLPSSSLSPAWAARHAEAHHQGRHLAPSRLCAHGRAEETAAAEVWVLS